MESVKEVIVVEGRYDKNVVSQAVRACVIETGGFRIFSDKEKVSFLRTVAKEKGIIILTDSDSAGFLIRNHLKGLIGSEGVKHAYIPDIPGKEKRKSFPSKEGKLGVEGMKKDIIITALRNAGATFGDGEISEKREERITKADLFEAGLSGGRDSGKKRKELLRRLDLPERMTPNAMLDALNILYSRSEFLRVIYEAAPPHIQRL